MPPCRPAASTPIAINMFSRNWLDTHMHHRARRTNGATQTFRRPSHATSLSGSTTQPASRDAPAPQNSSTNAGVYVPPHAQPGRNGSSFEGRYSRDQLTQLFRIQQQAGDLNDGLSDLYMGVWEPHATNGAQR
jgi:PERQ amino acid-rich with GYF domain-containing protein